MTPDDAALTAVGVTLLASALLVVYLHRGLVKVLEGGGGHPDRATFWAGFAHALLILIPLVVQLSFVDPTAARSEAGSGLWLTLAHLKWGLIGLVGTLALVAALVAGLGGGRVVPVYVDPDHAEDLNRMMSRVREMRAGEVLRKARRVEE